MERRTKIRLKASAAPRSVDCSQSVPQVVSSNLGYVQLSQAEYDRNFGEYIEEEPINDAGEDVDVDAEMDDSAGEGEENVDEEEFDEGVTRFPSKRGHSGKAIRGASSSSSTSSVQKTGRKKNDEWRVKVPEVGGPEVGDLIPSFGAHKGQSSTNNMASMSNGVIEDRLSQMPDEVIVHILSCLPTIDAVRTMLLRRFGELWTLVHTLWFDFDEYRERMVVGGGLIDEPSVINAACVCFSRFVRNVLMLHRRSTIDSFHLYSCEFDVYSKDPKNFDDVQMWLRFATSRGVTNLHVAFMGPDDLPLPLCVFTCQSINTLEASGCIIEEYEDEQPFVMGSLRKLTLTNVGNYGDGYSQLISRCPSLEELIIDDPRGLLVLNITNPSVRKLYLRLEVYRYNGPDSLTLHCPNVKILDFSITSHSPPFQLFVTDVSSLEVVNVKELLANSWYGLVRAIVKNFRNAANFSFSRKAFKQLSSMKEVDFPQNYWKRLDLQPCWNHERCLQVILKLVKSSAKLEELIIDVKPSLDTRELLSSKVSTSGCKPLLYPELSSACVYPLLKTVTIHGYEKCCLGLLELVEELLQKAIVLEKLVITQGVNHQVTVEDRDFVKKVSSFKRVSTNAVVVFA